MKKRIMFWLCLVVFSFSLLLPVRSRAVTPLEPERSCTLTLYYTQDGTGFEELDIRIYRVAQAFPDGTFELISPFSAYPVNIHGIKTQQEWKTVATTLTAYIAADQIAPDRTEQTEESGTAVFTGLQTGLYLVSGVVAENDNGTYIFSDFLVYLPTPADSGFDYDVEARPKCSNFTPKEEYQIIKLWKDTGYTKSRPKSVTIDIYKDGVLQETQILSAENNWSYGWKVSADDPGKWTVTERNVPDKYKVTISENAETFTITNTRQTDPGEPPKTGDTFAFWPWVLTMCLSGSMLVILGIYSKRKR